MKENEIWKPIKGFEDKYKVSNFGRVYSIKRNNVLKQKKDKLGYCRVMLSKKITKLVHRIVAEAFIPNPNSLPIINHKDENPSNNCVWNLEWCTYKYNSNYGNCKKKRKFTWELKQLSKIQQYNKDGTLIKEWRNVEEASKKTLIPIKTIQRCLDGKRKFANIFVFKYKNVS